MSSREQSGISNCAVCSPCRHQRVLRNRPTARRHQNLCIARGALQTTSRWESAAAAFLGGAVPRETAHGWSPEAPRPVATGSGMLRLWEVWDEAGIRGIGLRVVAALEGRCWDVESNAEPAARVGRRNGASVVGGTKVSARAHLPSFTSIRFGCLDARSLRSCEKKHRNSQQEVAVMPRAMPGCPLPGHPF